MASLSRSEIEEKVVGYLKRVAASRGKADISLGPEAPLFDSGILDSMSLLDFVAFLEKCYEIEIPGRDILPENFGSHSAVTTYLCQRLRLPCADDTL